MNPDRFTRSPRGRTTVVAAVLIAAIEAAAMVLSYAPLHAWITSMGLWSDPIARLFPLLLDAAAITVQLAVILAISIRRTSL